ncbi:glucosaminidase domain-containing protein [Holospora curviuscula]|uniref:Mannosyl-glycoprotein endo-beta-N-acetylglucosamidase-like domain-containing protein n=1 Tax=Holospora curviuscula TaxID=1082868 RepID=A0A2S5R963_9PROT|nr:glucosaminidase domain-containing protein [Holospora curviuscula]PPE03742.1 hypothetical protein HCUR_00757 [Holospora curviuscula]
MTWHQIFLLSTGAFIIPSSSNARDNFAINIENTYRAWEQKQSLSQRKKDFVRVLCWRLWKENYHILCTRLALLNVIRKTRNKKLLTSKEKLFLKQACKYYKVSNWKYLIDRMDVVPISMAIAQSIQECGWGKSLGCVRKNSYFGMTKGNVCYKYDTPEQSVRAYVRTLNTHKGYETFRAKRRIMRERRQDLLGRTLVQELNTYCTDPKYPKIIHYIVQKYRLSVFDLMVGSVHRSMVVNQTRYQKEKEFRAHCCTLAQRPEGVKILAHALWIEIYQNFSKLFI